MIALYVQTLALLGLAYLAGACLACIVRRSLFKPVPALPGAARVVDPLPEYAAKPVPVAQPAPITTAAAAPVAAAVPAQDLKRIRLIDGLIETSLIRLGVTRYEHIAAWTAKDVERIGDALGVRERISQENWIEQAQILAKGGETDYARRRARGEIATAVPSLNEGRSTGITPTVVPALAVRPQPSTAGASAVVAEIITQAVPVRPAPAPTAAPVAPPAPSSAAIVSSPDVSSRAAFAQETLPPAVSVRPQTAHAHDDFLRIGHVDADLAKALEGHGVTRYVQMAQWSPLDVERFEGLLGTKGRIAHENWVEQAQILSRGGDTAYSRQYDRQQGLAQPLHPAKLADAIRGNAQREPQATGLTTGRNIGALPSVRSEAFKSEPAVEAPRRGLRTGGNDDLKRIRGIGVLIEKKLNSMGISSYEAIANWTAADIDRVSQTLDFKGRIERENWVEQARILASGGQTEFSRRVDRGEVETGRLKS
jgi:predicted flap endonuclease-1-like 5' DNA nuclease